MNSFCDRGGADEGEVVRGFAVLVSVSRGLNLIFTFEGVVVGGNLYCFRFVFGSLEISLSRFGGRGVRVNLRIGFDRHFLLLLMETLIYSFKADQRF